METLKQKINADYMSAFKAKNTIAKNLLSVIKGEYWCRKYVRRRCYQDFKENI